MQGRGARVEPSERELIRLAHLGRLVIVMADVVCGAVV